MKTYPHVQNGLASPQYQGRWAQQDRFCFGIPVESALLGAEVWRCDFVTKIDGCPYATS
jgi:hypothetical protein